MVTFLACLYIPDQYSIHRMCSKEMSQQDLGWKMHWCLLFIGWRTKEKAAFFSPKSFADGVWNNGLGVVGFVKEAGESMDLFEVVNHHKIQNRFSMLQYSLISNLWGVSNWRSSISTELGWLLWSILGEHGSNQPGKSMDDFHDFGDFGLEGGR